jgi:hypothetical protein
MKRSYKFRGIDWTNPEMVRAFNRDAQRRWRQKNRGRKRK